MKPLFRAVPLPESRAKVIADVTRLASRHPEAIGLGPDAKPEEIRAAVELSVTESQRDYQLFMNELYQVAVRRHVDTPIGMVTHLSIRRLDREAIRDWRDFQTIKNQLVGPLNEGVELYPAEPRVVDTANQYHLWVLEDRFARWPFGFQIGLVNYVDDGIAARQRPEEK